MRPLKWLLIAFTTCLPTQVALAQGEPTVIGVSTVGSGLEGADPGVGAISWHRARTRLSAGAEWGGTESANSAVGAYALFELERSGSIGAEMRFRGWLDWGLGGYAGPIFIWRPKTLLGVRAGASFSLPLTKELALVADLGFAAFPVGSDRPHNDAILMWLTTDFGLRIGF